MSKITKALSFITAGVISLSMAVPCAASYDKDITVDPLFVYGDVNNDGACNSRDLVRIMKYMAEAMRLRLMLILIPICGLMLKTLSDL